MQLTGGQYKGRKISTPCGVRPTLAIVRESVFSALDSYLGSFDNKKMLDMYLGSSIMTLEALSRGFKVTSFEINTQTIKAARQNCKALGADCRIFRADCIKYAKKLDESFDVIYADPPWSDCYLPIFEVCAQKLAQSGMAVVECDKKKKSNILKELDSMSTLELFKEKNYGRCCLLFVRLR